MSIPNTLKLTDVIGLIGIGFNSRMTAPHVFNFQLLGEVKRQKITEDLKMAFNDVAKKIVDWQKEIEVSRTEVFEIKNTELYYLIKDLGVKYANVLKADLRVLSTEEAMILFKELVKPYIKTL